MRTQIKSAFSSKVNSIGLPILALCWVSFFWGTTWMASKEGVKHMPALQLAGIRQLIGGVLYVCFFVYKKAPWPKPKQWRVIIILSILNFVLSNGLSTWGIQYISSGLGAIIGAIFPLWIVLISIFQGKKIAKLSIIGLVISFSGICVVFYDYLSDFLIADFRFGICISIIATFTWAFGTIYTGKKASSFNPYFSLGLQMLISSVVTFSFISATGSTVSLTAIPMNSWYAIAYLVVVGSILTFIAYIYMIQRLPVEISSIYAYINPIVAILLGTIIFGEPLTVAIAAGGVITSCGLYLINYSIRKTKL